MKAVFLRELRSYYTSMIGYLFAAVMLLFIGIYTVIVNFQGAFPYFEQVLSSLTFILLIIVPILTMRTISEEKRQKTDSLLYALPLSMTKIVLGKYFAILVVFAVPVLITCVYPLILSLFGTIYFGMTYAVILAFFMLVAAFIAVGVFVSSITENQIVAASITFLLILVNYLSTSLADFIPSTPQVSFIAFAVMGLLVGLVVRNLTKNTAVGLAVALVWIAVLLILLLTRRELFTGLFQRFLSSCSLFDRFNSFLRGIFDVRVLIFDVSVIAVALLLTVQSMEKRRWS